MRFDDLTDAELTTLKKILNVAVQIWDWESPTLYGLSIDEIAQIERDWPASFRENPFRAALAIHNVCGDFLGGSNAHRIKAELFTELFGGTRAEVESLFRGLRPELLAMIDRHRGGT